MADERIEVEIVLDDGSVRKGFANIKKEADTSAKNVGNSFDRAFGKLKGGIATLGKSILALGAAFASFQGIKGIISAANELETAFAEIKTIIPDITQANDRLRQSLINTSAEFGTTAAEQAKSFYQIVSAGITDTTQASELLTAANKLAVGGLTDVGTSIDILTTAVNSFESQGLGAARASDILFGTVRLGKTRVNELAGSLGQILPVASSLKVSFEEVSAAVAQLTVKGLSTSEAVTQLNAIFTAVLKKQKEAATLGPKVAKAFSIQSLQAKGLDGFLRDLNKSLGGSQEALVQLLGRVEGAKAIISLGSDNFKGLSDNIKELKESTGATDAAFKLISDTVEFQASQALSTLSSIFLDLGSGSGNVLLDTLKGLNKFLKSVKKNLDSLIKTFKLLTRVVVAFVIALKVAPAIFKLMSVEATIFRTRMGLLGLSLQNAGRKVKAFGRSFINIKRNLRLARVSLKQFVRGLRQLKTKGIKANLKSLGRGFRNLGRSIGVARKATKLLKASLTLGLALAFDFLLEKLQEINDSFGGLGNTFKFATLTIRQSFNEIIIDLIKFIQKAQKLPIVGKFFKGAFTGTLDKAKIDLKAINKEFDELVDNVVKARRAAAGFEDADLGGFDPRKKPEIDSPLPDSKKFDESLQSFRDKVTKLQNDLREKANETIFRLTEANERIFSETKTQTRKQLKETLDGLKAFQKTTLAVAAQISEAVNNGIGRGISSGIQQAVVALQKGENAFNAFGQAFLSVIGDLAIQIGTFMIAGSLGLQQLFSGNFTGGFLFGAALIALGTILKSAKSGSPFAGGGAPPGGDSVASPILGDDQLGRPAQNIDVRIEGNLIDPEGAAIAIADLLKEEGFGNNSVIT